jgi:hypothetical protein
MWIKFSVLSKSNIPGDIKIKSVAYSSQESHAGDIKVT